MAKECIYWIKNLDRRNKVLFSIFSIIGGMALVVGRLLSDDGTLRNASFVDIFLFFMATVSIFVLNVFFVYLIDSRRTKSGNNTDAFSWKRFIVWSAIIFALWIPFFLAYYPTLWNYDIAGELPEICGQEYANHHPIIHQLYVQAIIKLSLNLTGDYELGMVILSLIQMLLMSLILGYSIEMIRTWNSGRFLTGLLISYYGLMLFNPILVISQTKDIPYTMCFVILFIGLIYSIDKGLKLKQIIFYDVIAVLFMLNRKNGMFTLLFWAIISTIILIFKKKEQIKKIWTNLIITSLIFLSLNSMLVNIYNAYPARKEMAFVVPFQCLTNIAANNPDIVPEYGTGGSLFGVIDRDLLPEDLHTAYKYNWGWPVLKNWCTQPEEEFDTTKLIVAWIVNGFKYPIDTIDGWGKLLLGTWYPFDTSHARIYEGPEYERQGYLLTDFKKFSIFTERPQSKLPKLEEFLELFATDSIHQKIPIVSLLFVPATYIWLVFFFIVYSIYKKRYIELVLASLLLGQYITVLLGPSMPVRYMWPIMVTVPILLSRLSMGTER